MSTSPLVFSGISSFSQDFQTIVTRAVSIASLPIQQLQADQIDMLGRKQLLGNLGNAVASLGQAVSGLGTVGANRGLVGSSSNSSLAAISSVSATSPATYTLSEITSVARAASASSAGYADGSSTPGSSTGTVRLTVAGVEHTITLATAENNLAGLRNRINALGAGVTATVLTTGTGATPYYLSLTATGTGEKPITLTDDPDGAAVNLLSATDDGANAVFKINGVAVSKNSNLINDVVPGLAFTIAGTTDPGQTVTLALQNSRSKLKTALETFAGAFNAVRAQTDAQIGPQAGLLSGDLMVREAVSTLSALASYQGSGAIGGLAQLGVEFSSAGQASLNVSTFDSLSDAQIEAAFAFLGSGTSGFGALAARLTQLSHPVTGLIQTQQKQYDATDASLTARIAALNERVAGLRSGLSARLQAADALLAQLESQRNVLDATIQSLNLTLYGKKDN